MAVSANITLNILPTLTKAADLITGGLVAAPNITKSIPLTTGTGAGQVDLMYAKHHDVVAGSPVILDCVGTSLLNPLGDPIAMVKLKLAYFFAAAANAGNIEILGGSNPIPAIVKDVSDIIVLGNGAIEFFYDPDGITLVAATGDLLKLLSSAGTNGVDVLLLGTSA